VDPNSGYSRQVVWIDQAEYRPQQVVYYDRKDALLKTLRFRDYRQYLDQYWRADRFLMENHQTGKSTERRLKTCRLAPLSAALAARAGLERLPAAHSARPPGTRSATRGTPWPLPRQALPPPLKFCRLPSDSFPRRR
jgi:hypothetical protein